MATTESHVHEHGYRAAVVHELKPSLPGREGVGIVTELGPGVTEVAVGDCVAMPWLGYACGTCDHCVSGWETLCLERQNTGYSIEIAGGRVIAVDDVGDHHRAQG